MQGGHAGGRYGEETQKGEVEAAPWCRGESPGQHATGVRDAGGEQRVGERAVVEPGAQCPRLTSRTQS
jgi:hypothetical protein